MTDLDDVIEQGKNAARLINDPLIIKAFQDVEAGCMQELLASDPTNAALRESLYFQAKAIPAAFRRLIEWETEGIDAEVDIGIRNPDRTEKTDASEARQIEEDDIA